MKVRKANRLKDYDYSQNGFYFVTICPKDRVHFLGEMKCDEMILNESGKIAEKLWLEIPNHFEDVKLEIGRASCRARV